MGHGPPPVTTDEVVSAEEETMTRQRSDVLAASYEYCRTLHRVHGRTYYLATRLLPAWKRPHVHALYGFTRYTDEIVDALDGASPAERAARLRDWTDRFTAALDGAPVDDPVLPAGVHTAALVDLAPG